MVYHSSFVDDDGITKACGCPLLPLKTHIKGPAPASDPDKEDIVDEAITFFRANVFFKNFHIKSPADKLLIYLTFYINIALKRLEGCRTLAVGTKAIINLGLEKVPVPGEPGFPFPGLFTLPQSQEEAELLRNYLKQIREETSGRLLNCAYRANGSPNKWWLALAGDMDKKIDEQEQQITALKNQVEEWKGKCRQEEERSSNLNTLLQDRDNTIEELQARINTLKDARNNVWIQLQQSQAHRAELAAALQAERADNPHKWGPDASEQRFFTEEDMEWHAYTD